MPYMSSHQRSVEEGNEDGDVLSVEEDEDIIRLETSDEPIQDVERGIHLTFSDALEMMHEDSRRGGI
ncbi:hypothetical protein HAX54_009029 [Datura stramonium]|uniref:Uncharacterized protein n=1 Tax=Datura stramonium TaxID=4076 RepID=A0ABS8TEB5_DATST|nr:hypothetical protein [Datura stramonium]